MEEVVAPITCQIRGVELTFPGEPEGIPFEAIEALEAGKLSTFITLLIPDEQMAGLRALRPRFTVGEIRTVVDEVGPKLGFKSTGE